MYLSTKYSCPALTLTYHQYCVSLLELDFLTNREQRVRINDILSTVLSISTGAPQGCVLSAILFIIYTNELRSRIRNCHLIKYADDTVIV